MSQLAPRRDVRPVRRSRVEVRSIPAHVLRLRPVATLEKVIRKLRTINPWPFIAWTTLALSVLFLVAFCRGAT